MKKTIISLLITMTVFTACSQKEFSDGANDIGNDVGNFGKELFKVRK